jgi:hypothetical protein
MIGSIASGRGSLSGWTVGTPTTQRLEESTMKIIRWAAVAVTVLFVLFNIGAALDADQADWVQIVGGVLAVAGVPAAVGLALGRAWGRTAVIGVGVLNVAAAVAALVDDQSGAAVGLVLGGLAVVLGVVGAPGAGTDGHGLIRFRSRDPWYRDA